MAAASDANTIPPELQLTAGGREPGLIGPKEAGLGDNYDLAYFSTPESDPDSVYAAGSTVSFVCLVDGKKVRCEFEYSPVETIEGVALRRIPCPLRDVLERRFPSHPCGSGPEQPSGPPVEPKGPFVGSVPFVPGLTAGRHTITVITTDEDGTDPSPPTVEIFLDLAAPSKPKLLKAPPRASRIHKPRFKYTSADNKGFAEDTYTSTELFDARFRRLRPSGPTLGMGDPFGNYLEWRGPFCAMNRRCTQIVWPAYSAAGEGGTSFGVPEYLFPGLYELRVKAIDLVGNESALTTYRFRILPARRR